MGTYVYGMKAKTFPTPLGPVQASQFIYKPGWGPRDKTPKAAAMLMGRIESKFGANPPKMFVLGDPSSPDFASIKLPVPFGIHENPNGEIIFYDDDLSRLKTVGYLVRHPNGKVTFSKEYPQGA